MLLLRDFHGTCIFTIEGQDVSEPFKDLSCRFPVKFNTGSDEERCYHVDRFQISFGKPQSLDVNNSLDFCLQP